MVITELWDKMGQSKEQQEANFKKSAEKLPVGFVATPEDVCFLPFAFSPVLPVVNMRVLMCVSRSRRPICTVCEQITRTGR